MPASLATSEPARMRDGLACYEFGSGSPLLLVPNPQGMVGRSSAATNLAALLADVPRTVRTFDPPGAFRSAGLRPRLGLEEMLQCIDVVVDDVVDPIDVAGHSQASLVALAFALARPERVRRLVLIGAVDGGARATRRAHGMPWCWSPLDRRYWTFGWRSLRALTGSASDVIRLQRFVTAASYVDARKAPPSTVTPTDRRPRRAGWQVAVRRVDLHLDLPRITAPTLVCVGAYDPQTPPPSCRSIADAVPRGRLAIFEHSGHSPFDEEPVGFLQTIRAFLDAP